MRKLLKKIKDVLDYVPPFLCSHRLVYPVQGSDDYDDVVFECADCGKPSKI